jgi:hypothetical protein
MTNPAYLLIFTLALLLVGCGSHDHSPTAASPAADPHAGHDHGPAGVIAVPATVQSNLGITWATTEYRVVQGVVRLPGRFEAEPAGRRAYQAPFAGQLEVLVQPYQTVAVGDPLYRLHGEEWQRLQLGIAEGCTDGCGGDCGTASTADRNLAAGERHADALAASLTAWTDRVATLTALNQEIGGKASELAEATARVADLTVQIAQAQRDVIRLEREARGPDGTSATGLAAVRLRQLFARATAITGLTRAELEAKDAAGVPLWMATDAPVIRAVSAGVVEGAVSASGSWVEAQAAVLTVTDPSAVRLHAAGLQADLPRFTSGMTARIVASDPAVATALAASVVIGPVADATDRSVDLIARPLAGVTLPAWVRPGVTANLEVVLGGSPEEELAIPVAATIRDGLKTLLFRRDPERPDEVRAVEADLGASDGRWVVVHSGLKEGDQVVVGGIYPLKLSQQSGGSEAGHFEPDGTFHVGSH